MFRGAIILGIGFSLGYSKALQDSQEIKAMLRELIDALQESNESKKRQPTEEKTDFTTPEMVETPSAPIPNPATPEGE